MFSEPRQPSCRVALLASIAFLIGLAISYLSTATCCLGLSRLGAQRVMCTNLAASLTLPFVGAAYCWLIRRRAFAHLVTVTVGTLAAVTVVIWVGVRNTDADWLVTAIIFHAEFLAVFFSLAFWELSTRTFPGEVGGSSLAAVGIGFPIARIVAGMTAAGFATVGRPEDLLLLAAVATLLALGGMLVALRRLPAETTPSAPAAARKQTVKCRQPAVNASSYTLLIAVCCVYTVLGREFVQQLFRSAAAAYSADGGSLAGGCGIIDAANGALQIVCMAAVSGRVLKRFGPRPGMLAVPVSLGLGVAGMAATCCWLGQPVAVFWMASVARLSESVSRFSFQQSALQCLCGAMAESARTRLMAILETIVKPLSSLLAGGLLLLLHGYCGYEMSATMATIFVVAVAGSFTATRLCRNDKRTVLPA